MLVSDLLDTLPKASAFIAFVLIIASLSRDTAADVSYDLKVTPQSLAVGQSLTISVGLVNPSTPVGDIFIYIQKPGQSAVIVFSNRQGSCSFSGGYTGTIDACDITNNRYTITFPSVTSDHGGLWSVSAVVQKPAVSQKIQVVVKVPVTSVTVTPTSLIVNAEHQVTLTCNVNSDVTSPVTYIWKRTQGSSRLDPPSNAVSTTQGNGISNALQWTAANQDGGSYDCTASNDISSKSITSSSVNVTVYYKPRLDESQPQQSSQGGALKGSVTFTLIILANPAPSSATWSKGGVNLGARFTPSNVGLTYNLRVDDIHEQDYGIYTCRLVNTVGSANFSFTLNATGSPTTPSDLIVVTRTSTSITLSWTSEFSGATNQLFSLQYNLMDGSWSPEVYNITDLGKGRTVIHEVTGLQPETPYTFRVGSKNNLGLISNYTPEVANLTKVSLTQFAGFTVPGRYGNRVTVTWFVGEKFANDYKNAVVVVDYTAERTNGETDNPRTKTVRGAFTDGKIEFQVANDETYTFNVSLRDDGQEVYTQKNLRIQDPSVDVPHVVAGVLSSFLILVVVILIILAVLIRRGLVTFPCSEPPEQGEEGHEEPSEKVPELSPYVDFPETRSKTTSRIDMLKKRLSGTRNSDDLQPVFSQKNGTTADFNPYAEASFTEQPSTSSADTVQGKPLKTIKNMFKIKSKGDTSNGSTGKSSDKEASQSGFVDDISPYGESKSIPNLSNPEPGYAEANKLMMPNPTEPQYAKVDFSKKSTPPKPPVVFHTNTATHPSPVYNGQDHTDTAPPPHPVYAEVDLSMKSRNQPEPIYAQIDKSTKAQQQWPQDDTVIYADVESPSDSQHDGKPVRKPKPRPPVKPGSPGPDEDTYANLGSTPGSDANVLYANLTNVVEQPEKPTTSVGIDGILYTELVFTNTTPNDTTKPSDETTYAEIDFIKSTPKNT